MNAESRIHAGAVDIRTADPGKGEHVFASSSSPTKAAAPTKRGPSANSILAAGLQFAKSRQNAYGAPKAPAAPVKMRQPPPLQRPVEPAAACTKVTTETNGTDTANNLPLVPSDQSRSDLTPSSMVFALASPATIAAADIVTTRRETQEDAAAGVDLEKAMYFASWGKPEEREGGGRPFHPPCLAPTLLTQVFTSSRAEAKTHHLRRPFLGMRSDSVLHRRPCIR